VAFAIFAGIAWISVLKMQGKPVRDVFDLMFWLFQAFWVLEWSVGVVILAALAVPVLLKIASDLRAHRREHGTFISTSADRS
jgi:hypothetical protein